MSGIFRTKRIANFKLVRTLTYTKALSANFRMQKRYYHFASIPDYDRTKEKYRKGKDILGCYMPKEEFNKYYESVCEELDVPPEVDNATTDIIREMVLDKFDDIDDIHHQISSPDESIR